MNSYFIPGLTTKQKEKLEANFVSFYEFVAGEEHGIMLEEHYLDGALVVLEARIASQAPHLYEGVVRVVIDDSNLPLPQAEQVPKLTTQHWNGANQAGMANIAMQQLLPHLRRDIVIHNPRQVVEPIKDGKFYIHVYSSAARCHHGVRPPTHMWGIPVDSSENAWPATGMGVAFVDESTGYAVAELVGDSNLYIHHDLARTGSLNEERLFHLLLEKVLRTLMPKQSTEHAKALFIEECCKSMTRALLRVGHEPEADHDRLVRESNKQLAAVVRTAQADEAKLLRNENYSLEAFGIEFDNLLKIPKITDVTVENGKVIVSTVVLSAKDDRTGYYHEIGAFKIHLDPARTSPLWFNQTRIIKGYQENMHAPHIYWDGHACLGNSAEGFKSLFEQRQWALAAQLAIEFVESANTADTAGQKVHHWPRRR